MKYPGVVMVGPKASGEVLSVAYAGQGQHQDAGAKMVHAAPETTSKIVSKSTRRTAVARAIAVSFVSKATRTDARATCSAMR